MTAAIYARHYAISLCLAFAAACATTPSGGTSTASTEAETGQGQGSIGSASAARADGAASALPTFSASVAGGHTATGSQPKPTGDTDAPVVASGEPVVSPATGGTTTVAAKNGKRHLATGHHDGKWQRQRYGRKRQRDDPCLCRESGRATLPRICQKNPLARAQKRSRLTTIPMAKVAAVGLIISTTFYSKPVGSFGHLRDVFRLRQRKPSRIRLGAGSAHSR